MNNEVQIGQPVMEDKELAKIIARSPTYIGLESYAVLPTALCPVERCVHRAKH